MPSRAQAALYITTDLAANLGTLRELLRPRNRDLGLLAVRLVAPGATEVVEGRHRGGRRIHVRERRER